MVVEEEVEEDVGDEVVVLLVLLLVLAADVDGVTIVENVDDMEDEETEVFLVVLEGTDVDEGDALLVRLVVVGLAVGVGVVLVELRLVDLEVVELVVDFEVEVVLEIAVLVLVVLDVEVVLRVVLLVTLPGLGKNMKKPWHECNAAIRSTSCEERISDKCNSWAPKTDFVKR